MQAYLRQTLVGERLVLFGQILSDIVFPGQTPGEDIAAGFKWTGWRPDSELFPCQVKDPTLTQDALRQSTSSFHGKVFKRMQFRQEANANWSVKVFLFS